MVIAPPIFATLVAGIAGAGHFKVVGRMGLRALIYFEVVTTLALIIGLAAVNLTKPGVGVNLPLGAQSDISATPQTWDQILLHVVPESLLDAMACECLIVVQHRPGRMIGRKVGLCSPGGPCEPCSSSRTS
jgi:proton glutamate symport protein